MTFEVVEVRSGSYHDSVTLMQVTRGVAAVPGVLATQVAMGTELNLDLLAGLGLPRPDGAGPNDLVIAVRATAEASLAAGRDAAEAALPGRSTRRWRWSRCRDHMPSARRWTPCSQAWM